ncbi:MAG TPA: helix-turn-helix transcriptional regulator [Chloroflexota bacterium]|nr:helix-turn-helix transcriptional regulator [Chloroflexota bacterium]
MSATAVNPADELPAQDTPEAPTSGESSTQTSTQAYSPEGTTLERMARLKHLVREEGQSTEEAARSVGVDPIVAQLWLRLPDDLWPHARTTGNAAGRTATAVTLPPPVAPAGGLRRVITCRVPAPAYERLRASDTPLLEAAAAALTTAITLPRPERAAGSGRYPRRPLALPISADEFSAIASLAAEAFDGDVREASGWLIARGIGMAIPLPTADELSNTATTSSISVPTAAQRAAATAPPVRFVVPPRRRAETRAPLPPDDSAPDGEELRRRRDEIGISQRDLAAASGLSRGLVAEVERGRRRHVLTRLRIAETLASLARSK